MIADMTSLISGIIDALEELIAPADGQSSVAYIALLAMPVLAGVVAFARRLVKKAKN